MLPKLIQKTYAEAIKEYEQFEKELKELEIKDETIQIILDKMFDTLDTIKSTQLHYMIERESAKDKILTEFSKNVLLKDLEFSREMETFINRTEQIELMQFRESTKLREALRRVLDHYEDYEATIIEENKEHKKVGKPPIQIKKILHFPEQLPKLLTKYSKCSSNKEKKEILGQIKKIPDIEEFKDFLKEKGVIL